MGLDEFWASPPEYMEFRENRSFADVGAYRTGEVNVTGRDGARRVRSVLVDNHLLRTLGVQAVRGRLLHAGEAQVNGPPVVLLSYHFWQAAFGGEEIVGHAIDVDGIRREVIGILEPGADVMDYRTEVWLPFELDPAVWKNRASHGFYLIGRLKDDVTQASVETGATPELYYFTEQTARRSPTPAAMHFVLRTVLPPASLISAIKEAIGTQYEAIPIVKLREMEEVFAESIRRPLLLARLLTHAPLNLL